MFAVFHMGGHPDNNGDQNLSFLLDKNMICIGGKSITEREDIVKILNKATYFISYKSKKLFNETSGWYNIYKKTGAVHTIDNVEKWCLITNKESTQDTIDYFEENGKDYLIHVEKVYDGKIIIDKLPKMKRLQMITSVNSVEILVNLV